MATDPSGASRILSARVDAETIETALREIAWHLPNEGHVSHAHPTGQRFAYAPLHCPECRRKILLAVAAKEVLYA